MIFGMNNIAYISRLISYLRKFITLSQRFFILIIIWSLCLLCLLSCQTTLQKNSKVINLKVWQGINPPNNRDVFNNLVDKFNQTHTDIQVESIFAGALEQQLPKILTAVVGNSAPDMLLFYPQITGQFVELDAILRLDDWFDKLPINSEIISNILQEVKLDGQIWSIPYTTANIGIFYRPDLFQAAGITQTPKNWEELIEVANKLTIDKNGDKRPEQYGILLPFGKGEWSVFSWFPFLLSAGGEIVTDNHPNLNNPTAISALKLWENLLEDGLATLSPPERGYEEDAFFSGRVAMQITGPWSYITKSQVPFDAFPIPADVTHATVTGTGNIFVMKTNPEREKAALKFLEFVLSEEFQTEWAIGTGFLPVNIKSAQSPEYQEYLKSRPWLKVFVDQIPVAGSRPTLAGYSRISDSLGRAIEATLLGKSSAEVALKQAQERLEVIWGEK
jgi:multiple sugar transport system substrate-binding protein